MCWPTPATSAMEHGDERRHRGVDAAHVQRLVPSAADRRQRMVVVPAAPHRSAGGEERQVGRLLPRPRTTATERRDRGHDQIGAQLHEVVVVDAPLREPSRRLALEHDVHGPDETAEEIEVIVAVVEIERDAELARLVVPPPEAALGSGHVVDEGPVPARVVPGARLHQHDLRAEVREQLARVRRPLARELHDAEPCERSLAPRAAACRRHSTPSSRSSSISGGAETEQLAEHVRRCAGRAAVRRARCASRSRRGERAARRHARGPSRDARRRATAPSRRWRDPRRCVRAASAPRRPGHRRPGVRSRRRTCRASRVHAPTIASSASSSASRPGSASNRPSARRGSRDDAAQRPPVAVVAAGDGDPAVVATRRVDAVRRHGRRLAAIASAASRAGGAVARSPCSRAPPDPSSAAPASVHDMSTHWPSPVRARCTRPARIARAIRLAPWWSMYE